MPPRRLPPAPPGPPGPPGQRRPSPRELGFAQMVGAIGAPASPAKPPRRRRAAAHAPVADGAAEPAASLLERAFRLVRGGQLEAGMALCRRVWPEVSASGDVLQMGNCQHILAVAHQYGGRLHEAFTAAEAGIALFSRAGDPARLLRLLALQAITAAQLGQEGEALALLERAIALLPAVGDDAWQQAVFWNNAGSVHQSLGQLERAQDAWERCGELAARHGDANLVEVSRCNLLTCRVVLRHRRGEPAQALDAALAELLRCLKDNAAAGRHHLVPAPAAEAADALIGLGRLDDAAEVLRLGCHCARAAGFGPGRAGLELQLARVARLQGRHRHAAAHLAEAQQLAWQGQDTELIARLHLENSQLQEAQHHWRAALDALKRYAQMREARLVARADLRLQALAARLELARQAGYQRRSSV